MSINFISVPKEVQVQSNWLDTPTEDQEKIKQVAHSYLAHWKDERLQNMNTSLLVGKVTFVVGAGASIFFMSIPGVILCGAGLIVCFLGSHAIRREQIARCRDVCLHLENWFMRFKQVGDDLNEVFEPFADKVEDKNFELDDEACQTILKNLEEFPENQLQDLAEELKKHHEYLFGKERKIGNGTWSHYWIENHIQHAFDLDLAQYYKKMLFLKKTLTETNSELKNSIKTSLMYSFNNFMKEHLKTAVSKDTDPVGNKAVMYLLSNRDASPQGQEYFSNIMEQAEYWRQNVAIFRHSLV